MRQSIDALVLAGGRPDPVLTGGPLPKAFAPVAGRAMVEYVLSALRATPRIRRVALVGPLPLPPAVAAAVDVPVREQGGLLENVAAGLAALVPPAPSGSDEAPVLAVAADIPLLTAPAIDAFLDAAGETGGDLGYAVVPREDLARAFPGVRKTVVRLREGTFTGGSLVLMRPLAFFQAREMIDRAIRARKRPWDLARLFGLRTLLGLVTGGLRIADLERRATRLTGIAARAVICHHPEVALDVDHPDSLAIVERHLAGRRPPGGIPPEPPKGARGARRSEGAPRAGVQAGEMGSR